jgi:uncharacterized repeat protein (TIGR01451 family)
MNEQGLLKVSRVDERPTARQSVRHTGPPLTVPLLAARRLLIALVSVGIVTPVLAAAIPAGAAFPGANGKIVFAFASSDVVDTYEIYVMNPDGSGRTRLTTNSAADYYPAWSPDGSKIAFTSYRDGNAEIYVMNPDGTGQTRLTTNTWIDFSPAWSPDGSKIAFGTTRDGNYEIYVMNADGTGQTNLTNNAAEDQFAAWSPDGIKIAFASLRNGDRDILTMNPDGTGQTNITNVGGSDGNPDWSPDGSKITFESFRDGNNEVYVMNDDGTGQTRLTTDPSTDAWPVWSPDGTKVAFGSTRDGNTEIYTMNTDGTAQTRLTNNSTSDYYLDWQPLPPDTNPPDTAITSTPHGTTSDHLPVFTFESSESGSTFECRLDSSAEANFVPCTSPWKVAWRWDGQHSFDVRATDGAGNVDASPAREVLTVATSPSGLVGWGNLGPPPLGTDYVAIAVGGYTGSPQHALALRSNGTIVGWGDVGAPPSGNDYVAIAAGNAHGVALRNDGSLVGWGDNTYGQATPPAGSDYVAISAGQWHGLALRSNGSIVGWGNNGGGQLNIPAGTEYVAIAAGLYHGLALRQDGSIVGWGSNIFGQASPPAGNDYVAIAAGSWHGLALRSDGSIVGWGYNSDGQDSPPAGNDYIAIAGGYYHSLALRSDGSLVGWGSNYRGESIPPAGNGHVAIAAGGWNGLALGPVGPPPTISGDLSCNSVVGSGFASNSIVSVVVKDAPGGTTAYSNASVPTDGTGSFNLFCDFGPDLVPGMEITVSQGAPTKVLVLVDLTIDAVNPATDVVSGTAPAGAEVQVGVNNPGPGGAGLSTTADGTGNWSVDFTGTFDITAGTHSNASVPDADGDRTSVKRQPPSINGNITDDFIGGEGFEQNATVTVEVRDGPGGALLFSATVPTDGGGSFGLCCGPEVGLPDLVPGMEITVSDGSSTKVLALVSVTIDVLDPATDVVSGTAPANATLFVGVNNPSGEAGLNTTADGSGNWSVDFTGSFDIDALTQAEVAVSDNDGDATSAQERPATIHASYCCGGNISGQDLTPNSSVTLEIFDSPGGTVLFSEVVPTDRFGSFEFNLEPTGVILSSGMHIVATDAASSDAKELTLVPLTFDALNPTTDTATGTAEPGTAVLVEVFADFSPTLEVVADGTGTWLADFGAAGFNVTSAMGASARIPDDDGDTTNDEVFPPTISGNLVADFVSGSDFTPNATVDVEIFESPGGALLFSGSVPTGGEFGDFGLDVETHGVDLLPGTHIVVTDGVSSATKAVTLVPLTFDMLDPLTDTASGTTSPNATVFLEVFDSGGEISVQTTADGTGAWSVDLGAEGFDVVQGGGIATVQDDDGDGTVADRGIPTFSATPSTDEVGGFNFTNSSTVTVEIFDSPGGTLLFSGPVPVGSDSTFTLGSGTHGVDLASGMHITVTDDTTAITKELTLVQVTFEVLDPVNEVASGTAPPGMRLGLQFPDGGGEIAPADASGNWFVDLGADGGDLAPDVRATICAVDADGDCTAEEYVPEADLLLTKTDPPGRQPTSRNMTYTLTVSNLGPRAAYETVATDQLPSSVTFVSATPAQGSCNHSGGTVTCTLGTIGTGATVTIAIVVRPTVAGTITNTASVTASTPDPAGGNNADSESTSICRITSRRSSIPCG